MIMFKKMSKKLLGGLMGAAVVGSLFSFTAFANSNAVQNTDTASISTTSLGVNLIENGSFENGAPGSSKLVFYNTFPGWNLEGGGLEVRTTPLWIGPDRYGKETWMTAAHGSAMAELNSDFDKPVTIYQDLRTIPGSILEIRYAYTSRNGFPTDMSCHVGAPGYETAKQRTTHTTNTQTAKWEYTSFRYTVPSGQTTTRVKFVPNNGVGGFDASAGNDIDDISVTAVYIPSQNSTICFYAGNNGRISGNTALSVPANSRIPSVPNTIPDNGYSHRYWIGSDGKTYNSTEILNIVPNGNMSFIAIFEKEKAATCAVDYKTDGNGKIIGYTSTFVNLGSSPTFVPTQLKANAGYVFSHWRGENGNSYTAQQIMQTPVTKQVTTYTAIFVQDPAYDAYKINFTHTSGGTLSGNTTLSVRKGQPIATTPVPVPDANCAFQYWYGSDGAFYTTAQIESLVPQSDMVFTAVFEKTSSENSNISFISDGNGSLSGNTNLVIMRGNKIQTVPTPVPNSGYAFKNWTYGNKSYSSAEVQELIPDTDMTFTAVFEKVASSKITITFNCQNGKFTGNTATQFTINYGDEICIVPSSFQADPGYVASYFVDQYGNEYMKTVQIMKMAATEDMTFTLVCVPQSSLPSGTYYTKSAVMYYSCGNGKILGLNSQSFQSGTAPTFIPTNIVPDPGYKFDGWIDRYGRRVDNQQVLQITSNGNLLMYQAVFVKA